MFSYFWGLRVFLWDSTCGGPYQVTCREGGVTCLRVLTKLYIMSLPLLCIISPSSMSRPDLPSLVQVWRSLMHMHNGHMCTLVFPQPCNGQACTELRWGTRMHTLKVMHVHWDPGASNPESLRAGASGVQCTAWPSNMFNTGGDLLASPQVMGTLMVPLLRLIPPHVYKRE